MKIVCWNVWSGNRHCVESLNLILSRDPDIICLQELPKRFMDYKIFLSDYDLFFSLDYKFYEKLYRRKSLSYLLIAVKKKYNARGRKLNLSNQKSKYSIMDNLTGWEECLESTVVEFEYDGETISLANLHLGLLPSPRTKLRQFAYVAGLLKSNNIIICGDLNIIPRKYSVFLYWVTGKFWSDFLFNERRNFESLFRGFNLKNVFRGSRTNSWPRIQLDHILVPEEWRIRHKYVFHEAYSYSDHAMLYLEVDR